MAAILRASVRRAIEGSIPFGQQSLVENMEGSRTDSRSCRRTLQDAF